MQLLLTTVADMKLKVARRMSWRCRNRQVAVTEEFDGEQEVNGRKEIIRVGRG